MAAEEVGVHRKSLAFSGALSAITAGGQVQDADAAAFVVLEHTCRWMSSA